MSEAVSRLGPYSENSMVHGHVLDVLAQLLDECVHMVCCSPPYWGLRDYGTEPQEWPDGWRGSLGLEPSPDLYVQHIVEIFREVRRVLRGDGTLWLNLGSSYATGTTAGRPAASPTSGLGAKTEAAQNAVPRCGTPAGFKTKDLVPIPWMVAMALQQDGWVLRNDVIWSKTNPMPESVRDRCTMAHEYLFLFSKAKWRGKGPSRFEDMTQEDRRWIALLLETEGNITVKHAKGKEGHADMYGIQIAVGNVSKRLISTARTMVGAGAVGKRKGTNAPIWYWQVSNKQARDLLWVLYPYLMVKKRQARIGIYLESLLYNRGGPTAPNKHRTRKENELLKRLWESNKECNHFGEPDLSWVPEPNYGRWDSQRYFYDAEAIRERSRDAVGTHRGGSLVNIALGKKPQGDPKIAWHSRGGSIDSLLSTGTRNKRTVWELATKPLKDAHFATFPPKLVEPCILAGTSAKGVCPECGGPWERMVEKSVTYESNAGKAATRSGEWALSEVDHPRSDVGRLVHDVRYGPTVHSRTIGWRPTCTCYDSLYCDEFPKARSARKRWQRDVSGDWWRRVRRRPGISHWRTKPAVIADIFMGSGTVAKVALEHRRHYFGIDLQPEYVAMSERRIASVQPQLF